MSRIIFFRRKKLGLGSVRGMSWRINNDDDAPKKRKMGGYVGDKSGYVRNDFLDRLVKLRPDDLLIRWGCTSETNGVPANQQLNPSKAISEVGMKRTFRQKCEKESPGLAPKSYFNLNEVPDGELNPHLVVRRDKHAQGKDLWVVKSKAELQRLIGDKNLISWYASELIDKVKEYRVYMVEGRVVTIAEKTPDNPQDVAWNVAQGGRFDVLKWGDWPMGVCECADEAFDLTSLDFAGIDIMVDREGEAFLIEVNSAPSLPFLDDGRLSYRQRVMADAFSWIAEHGRDNVKAIIQHEGWRDVIHPSQWNKKDGRIKKEKNDG